MFLEKTVMFTQTTHTYGEVFHGFLAAVAAKTSMHAKSCSTTCLLLYNECHEPRAKFLFPGRKRGVLTSMFFLCSFFMRSRSSSPRFSRSSSSYEDTLTTGVGLSQVVHDKNRPDLHTSRISSLLFKVNERTTKEGPNGIRREGP